MPLTPGDVVRCSTCGTEAVAYTTAPGLWQPWHPVLVSWHGFRTVVAHEPPARCLPCALGDPIPPPATRRAEICRALAVRGARPSGFEWNTDDAIEAAFQRWITRGSPALDVVEVNPGDAVAFVPVDRDYKRGELVAAQAPKRSTKPPPAQGSLF